MDGKARALPPSISVAAHAVFAAGLAFAPLLGAIALPPTASRHAAAEPVVFSIRLAGGGAPRMGRVGPPRVASRAGLVVPTSPATVPVPEPIDLSGDGLVPGFTDGPGDASGSSGFCLSDCAAVPAVSAAEPAAAHHGPYRTGGDIREPVRLRSVAPAYPPLAVSARVEGRVVLDCVIDEQGRVSDIVVIEGHPLLDGAAADAVRQWRYRPTLLNGVPVAVRLQVVVSFRFR
jgi:TonB family protein